MSLVTTTNRLIIRRLLQEWLLFVQLLLSLLWWSAAYAAAIVLRFDGSVRPWTDPGFPRIARLARSKKDHHHLDDALVAARHCTAGCAASVQFLLPQHNNFSSNTTILVVGGKCLPNVKTSAEAEYEGLLFGLEIVADLLAAAAAASKISNSNELLACSKTLPIIRDGHGNLLLPSKEEKELIIQGDCKTVLQQIRGTSRARKLDTYHVKADHLMSRINNNNNNNKGNEGRKPALFNIEMEHIPRQYNRLCDMVAAQTVLWQLEQAERATWEELESARSSTKEDNCHCFVLESLWWKHRIKHVPHSRRPWFYQTLAEIAMESGEYPSLVSIGEFMERELKKVWTRCSPKTDETVLQQLLVASVLFQLAGWTRLNRRKKVTFLQNTHRHLLLRCGIISADLVDRIVNQNESISIVRSLLPPSPPPTTTSPLMMGTSTDSVVTTTTCAKDTDGITPSSLQQLTAQAFATEEWLQSGYFVFSTIIERADDSLGGT